MQNGTTPVYYEANMGLDEMGGHKTQSNLQEMQTQMACSVLTLAESMLLHVSPSIQFLIAIYTVYVVNCAVVHNL